MPGPLGGISVLEVASFIAGPYAGALLADLGAEVIKVENPDGGDPFRAWDLGGDPPTFWAYNRGKKSITLNLRTPAAADLFRQLAQTADVVLENLRPGSMERLGLGFEQLSALNPRLVYCGVTGFGRGGPYAQRPAYDGVGQALSGMLSMLSERAAACIVGPNFSDSLAALFAAYGILGALVARGQTGRGQRVDSTLLGSTLAFLVAPATDTLAGAPPPGPISRPIASQTYAWNAGDGLPFSVHLSSPPKFWQGLARAVERPDLLDDERFRTRPDRQRNYEALRAELAAAFATRSRAEWLARLEAEDVPCAPIYDMAEVFTDPQVRHMGLEVTIPRRGKPAIRTVGCPVQYSDTPPAAPGPPPELGEHTDEVLTCLGYDRKAIDAFRAAGVL